MAGGAHLRTGSASRTRGSCPVAVFATDPREICFVQPLITRASTDIEVSVQVTGSGLQQGQLVLAW